MDTSTAASIRQLEESVERVLVGKPDVVRLAIVALLARGHLLIEDVPGVGKTTLAQALARSLGVAFQRIQFTSDLLPSDILGVSVFDPRKTEFEFRPGPIFANIILADEINRTTPKTQSSLLEAMNEGQVSLDHHTHRLPLPFMVLATQNPLEYQGTHPLPESQMDRFLLRIRVGYPDEAHERLILRGAGAATLERLRPVLDADAVLALQAQAESGEGGGEPAGLCDGDRPGDPGSRGPGPWRESARLAGPGAGGQGPGADRGAGVLPPG